MASVQNIVRRGGTWWWRRKLSVAGCKLSLAFSLRTSVRSLPIHPELIRLGFLDYIREIRSLGHELLFPEMRAPGSKSIASTFYKSIFKPWREWAFPEGTRWRHRQKGMIKDKDVHSFRGTAASLLKGRVPDSVRIDILGHEGENETTRTYDEEADLASKLEALLILSVLTQHCSHVAAASAG